MSVMIGDDGKFEPLPRERWEKAVGLTICPDCNEKALGYRISHDDFPCFNCGAVKDRDYVWAKRHAESVA